MTEKKQHSTLFYESVRKLIHLSALVVPIAYLFFNKNIIIGLIIFGLVIALFVEWLRRNNDNFSNFFYHWLLPLLRDSERTGLTASTLMIIGALITVIVFPKDVAIFGLLTAIISDASAGLIGKTFGKHVLYKNKTWEGSSAFFVSTLVISLLILNYPLLNLILISASISIVELLLKKADNLVIPVVSGILVLVIG